MKTIEYAYFMFTILCITNYETVLSSSDAGLESDVSSCNWISTDGYRYSHSFRIPTSSFRKDGSMIFSFYVQTISDAHVLLFQDLNATNAYTTSYEIVIGGGKNSYSEIRRTRLSSAQTHVTTKNILNRMKMINFMIKIEDGLITVWKVGDQLPFLSWKDANPLEVKYFAFSSWRGVFGKWGFLCQGEGKVAGAEKLQEGPRNLKAFDKLKEDLLEKYDPYSIPIMDDDIINIDVNLNLDYINLDAKKAALTLQGKFIFKWFDPKMQWYPGGFDNISFLHLPHHSIWRPEFILYNAIGDSWSPMERTWMTVTSGGQVTWSPRANLLTKCELDLTMWPWDEHNCAVKLGLFAYQDFIEINVSKNFTQFKGKIGGNDWEITSVVAETRLVRIPWQSEAEYEPNENAKKTSLVLRFGLKRQSYSYSIFFFLPVLVIMSLTFSSFWLPPIKYERIWLLSLALILLTLFMLVIDQKIPALPKGTPFLLYLYSRGIILTTTCTLGTIAVALIMEKDSSSPPPILVSRILNSQLTHKILCLSQVSSYEDSSTYEEIKDAKHTGPWTTLAMAVDRALFLVTSLIFVLSMF